jgi:hypothetical protein
MDKEVTNLGYLTLGGKRVAELIGVCIVKNLLTWEEEALIAAEYTSGEVRLSIVEVGE